MYWLAFPFALLFLGGITVDDWYSFGRYGVFINAGNSLNYTYRVDLIRIWRHLD